MQQKRKQWSCTSAGPTQTRSGKGDVAPIAAGALVAVLRRTTGIERWQRTAETVLFFGVVATAVFEHWTNDHTHTLTSYMFLESSIAVTLGGALIVAMIRTPAMLCNPILVWIGQVSYGIYVFHGAILPWATQHIGSPMLRTAVLLVAGTSLAALSWYTFERPILSLKNRLAPQRIGLPSAAMVRSARGHAFRRVP